MKLPMTLAGVIGIVCWLILTSVTGSISAKLNLEKSDLIYTFYSPLLIGLLTPLICGLLVKPRLRAALTGSVTMLIPFAGISLLLGPMDADDRPYQSAAALIGGVSVSVLLLYGFVVLLRRSRLGKIVSK